MGLTEMIVSGLIKRGVLYEAKNVDVEFELPRQQTEGEESVSERIKIYVKADHMSIKVDKKAEP